jgi:hypothetical protein
MPLLCCYLERPLSLSIIFVNPVLIVSADDMFNPLPVIQVPVDSYIKPSSNVYFCRQPSSFFILSQLMAYRLCGHAVSDMCYQCLNFISRCRYSCHFSHMTCTVNIFPFISTANIIVSPVRPAISSKRAVMIIHIQPVPNIFAIAINRQGCR